jgi:hypothetical protein
MHEILTDCFKFETDRVSELLGGSSVTRQKPPIRRRNRAFNLLQVVTAFARRNLGRIALVEANGQYPKLLAYLGIRPIDCVGNPVQLWGTNASASKVVEC